MWGKPSMKLNHLHITGASGCGTTTLGQALSSHLGCPFFDADDFFWKPTVPPYREKKPREERLTLALQALARHDSWVLSGSICGWGSALEQAFDLVIFLSVPTEVRLRRLVEREQRKLGQVDPEFIDWAAQYDTGDLNMRSRAMHEQWLAALTCPVLRLSGEDPVAELVAKVMAV